MNSMSLDLDCMKSVNSRIFRKAQYSIEYSEGKLNVRIGVSIGIAYLPSDSVTCKLDIW